VHTVADVSKPVHWSTTTTGDCAVLRPAAQDGIASFRATTPAAQVGQLDGFIGMSCATTIFMTTSGLAASRHGGSWSLSAMPVAAYPPWPSLSPSYV
jgi:hypothetical protein